MCVNVNKTGRNDEALSIHLGFGGARDSTDLCDASVFDGQVAEESRVAGAVDDAAMTDDEVERLGIERHSSNKADNAKEQAKTSFHRASYTFAGEEKRQD
jgi:hypothetical protein